MSAQAGSIGGIILGTALLVGGAIALFTPGGALGVGAIIAGISLIAGGAIGLTFNPKAPNQLGARTHDIEIATAGEGFPIPVLFGEQKVVGNFMNWTKDQFRSIEVRGKGGGGGKGGGSKPPPPVIGYEYFLTWEYGLCMGPIDECVQVWSAPGEKKMRGQNPAALVYGAEEYKEIILDSQDPTNPAGTESGTVRLYKGSSTQNRIPSGDPYQTGTERNSGTFIIGYLYKITARTTSNFTTVGAASNAIGTVFEATAHGSGLLNASNKCLEYTGLNYRNICWALFMDFKMGRHAQPKTYQFILRRHPRHDSSYEMKRPDGTSIAGFKVRGSGNSAHPCFHQANPAAVIYEIMTDQLWGRGLSQTLFNEATWITASTYFYNRNIGMSLLLETADKLADIIDGIRAHVKLLPLWDGELLKLRTLLDPSQTHSNIQTIRKSECGKVNVSRPLWPSTINDVRAEFNDATRNFRANTVQAQDLANIQITGRSNLKRVQLPAFTDFNTARRQAWRILRELSYPALAGTIEINRFKSQLEVGDVFRFEWDEWGANPITAYLQVIAMREASSHDDMIEIVVIEDIDLPALEGTESGNIFPTVEPWELIQDINQNELSLFVPPSPVNGEITPITAFELPAIATEGRQATTLILGQRPSQNVVAMQVQWTRDGKNQYADLGEAAAFAITGTLLTPLAIGPFCDRSAEAFQFSLTNAALDESTLLGNVNKVDTANHDLETLLDSGQDYFAIDDELIQVGKVDQIGTNIFRARNIIRGVLGTRQSAHAVGAKFFYRRDVTSGFDTSRLPIDEKIQFKAYPKSTNGLTLVGNPFYPVHAGAHNQKHLGLGRRPLKPEAVRLTVAGSTISVVVRPRFFDRGAGTAPLFGIYNATTDLVSGEIRNLISSLNGMSFQIRINENAQFYGASQGRVLDFLNAPQELVTTYTPDEMNASGRGLVTISNIPTVVRHRLTGLMQNETVRKITVHSYFNNQLSVDGAQFSV